MASSPRHTSLHNLKLVCPHVDIKKLKHHVICTICPRARQSRLPFTSSSIKTLAPFQLIHIDVWGSYTQPTYNSCSYFLTIVDDFTRCIWIFLMKSKSESVFHLTNFIEYVATQFNSTVHTVRSNNAKELCHGPILQTIFPKALFIKRVVSTHHNKTVLSAQTQTPS